MASRPQGSLKVFFAAGLVAASAGCECASDALTASDLPDSGTAIFDAGFPQPDDAGSPPPEDAGLGWTTPEVGCSDGTREGFLSQTQYPGIAACSGGWTNPGILAIGSPTDGGLGAVVPTCGRNSGNTSGNPDGIGCSSVDLCAQGWHICQGSVEVAANTNGAGCADAVPSSGSDIDTSSRNGSNYILFAVAQHSYAHSACDDTAGDDNDMFGCGVYGQQLTDANNQCGVLNQTLASTLPGTCAYSQAIPSNGPWRCVGSNSWNENDWVTKDGCPNNSCSEGGYSYGNADKGGVLCCREPGQTETDAGVQAE